MGKGSRTRRARARRASGPNPEAAAASAEAARQAEADKAARGRHIAELEARGVTVKADGQNRIVSAQRLDVFDLMRSRKTRDGAPLLTDKHVSAVRIVEAYMAVAAGVRNDAGPEVGFVQRSADGAPGQGFANAQIDAAEWLDAVWLRAGVIPARILRALLEPQFVPAPMIVSPLPPKHKPKPEPEPEPVAGEPEPEWIPEAERVRRQQGSALTRWRDTMRRVTGETNEDSYGALLRMSCASLAEAVAEVNRSPPKRYGQSTRAAA